MTDFPLKNLMLSVKKVLTNIKKCDIIGANRQVASNNVALRQICIDKSKKLW